MTRTALLVSGSRRLVERAAVIARFQHYPKGTILIHGNNGEFVRFSPEPFDGYWRGLDKIAHDLCRPFDFIPHPYPYFGDLGLQGGPKRNACMLGTLANLRAYGFECFFEAWPDAKSKGTRGMIALVERHNRMAPCGWSIPIHVTET